MTARLRVLAVCGSLGSNSKNHRLLRTAIDRAPSGVTIELAESVAQLPHFDPDLESSGAIESVERWRRAIVAADALLIACPEYGHGMPGALKNAIDWVIGSGELSGKLVAITAATASAERGLRGLGSLAATLRAVDARIVGGAPIVLGERFEDDVDGLVRELLDVLRAP